MSEISSKKIWAIGDRFQSKWDKSIISTLVKIREGGKKPYTIQHNNGRKVHCDKFWLLGMKFLEEKGVSGPCSDNLTSAQELVQDSVMQDSSTDLNLLEPQRLTNTVAVSLNCDIPTYTTTETCEICQDLQDTDLATICTEEESTLLQLPHPAPHSPQKGNAGEAQMSEIVSPPSLEPLENCNPNLQPLKTSQDSLPAPITQDNPQAHISEAWSVPLTSSGTMRNGLLSAVDTLPVPSLESEYCWLPSPGALSLSGKGRPPGQTKQEAELKKLGLINKGEVLNPAILCQWYEILNSWLDPLECRAATELLEECDRQQEIFSILESQRSPLTESSTLIPCVESQPLVRDNAKSGTYIINQSESLAIIKDNLGFGFVVNWLASSEEVTYNWERDDRLISGLAIAPQPLIDKFLEDKSQNECTQQLQIGVKIGDRIRIIKTRSSYLSQWIGHEGEVTGINGETISVAAGKGSEKKHLTIKKGWYEIIPENFLEETQPQPEAVQQPKGKQRRGCLYRYIENKKLKSGDITSYPRVIGHRQPNNPTHWRWGFNWEEKVDGEWKGRSIGSVPIGAIALVRSMQNEGAPLEEIIGFIRRTKSKKS